MPRLILQTQIGGQFGRAVAVSGDITVLVIGAEGESAVADNAYSFPR